MLGHSAIAGAAIGAPGSGGAKAAPSVNGARVGQSSMVAVVRETAATAGGSYMGQMSLIALVNETPPLAGGALIASSVVVAVQIEYFQPTRTQKVPLVTGPWGFPLFIARG